MLAEPTNIERATRIMRTLIVAALLAVGCCTGAMAQTVGGKYAVTGTNLDGSPYSGTATIARTSNSTCRIRWETGATSDGICMLAKPVVRRCLCHGECVRSRRLRAAR